MCWSPGLRGSALVLLALWVAGCDGATDPPPVTEPPPAAVRLAAETATSPAGLVGAELVPAPRVRATDAEGRAVAGVPVTFEVGDGDGEIATTAAETDEEGRATVGHWTLGTVAGAQTVTARAAGLADVVFTATAAAGSVAQVAAVGGNSQSAQVGMPLEAALRVRVADAFGNGVAGVQVTFSVMAGGGSIASEPAMTDAAGEATSGVWTLGPGSGEQQVRAGSGTASATFSAIAIGLPGRLAFVSSVQGNPNIYAVNADGTGLLQLTTDLALDLQPVWQPGGFRLNFVSQHDTVSRIYSVAANGGDIVGPMVDPTFTLDPARTTNGFNDLMMAYTSVTAGNAEVVLIHTGTGAMSVLTDEPGYDGQPSWSPDARRLAFVSDRMANHLVFDIYTMNADGTDQVRLTDGLELGPAGVRHYLHPAWSPDGSLIAFVWGEFLDGSPSAMRFHVAVMAPDGSAVRDLAWTGDIRNDLLDPGSLTWSPDGRGIAFGFADCDGAIEGCGHRSIKYVPLEGGTAFTLIPGGHSPSWRETNGGDPASGGPPD